MCSLSYSGLSLKFARALKYSSLAPDGIPMPTRSHLYVYVFAAVPVIVTLSFVVVCIYSRWS